MNDVCKFCGVEIVDWNATLADNVCIDCAEEGLDIED